MVSYSFWTKCNPCHTRLRLNSEKALWKHQKKHHKGNQPSQQTLNDLERFKKKYEDNIIDWSIVDWSVPLNKQELDNDFLPKLFENYFKIEIRTTSTDSGFLFKCPKCQIENKCFYSFDGKMFICLDYQGCGWKGWNLVHLKKELYKNGTK